MADGVAVVSVVASSTVALVAVAAQLWQSHLNRENERSAWLRDRSAEAYISVLRLFEKTPDKVPQEERERLMATLHAYGSLRMVGLFEEWRNAAALTWQEGAPEEALQKAYQDADSFQRQIEAQVVVELQGEGPPGRRRRR